MQKRNNKLWMITTKRLHKRKHVICIFSRIYSFLIKLNLIKKIQNHYNATIFKTDLTRFNNKLPKVKKVTYLINNDEKNGA